MIKLFGTIINYELDVWVYIYFCMASLCFGNCAKNHLILNECFFLRSAIYHKKLDILEWYFRFKCN